MFDYNKSVKLFVLVTAFFSSVSSLAMFIIDGKIAKLKQQRSDMINNIIEKKCGGNSAMAAREINGELFSEIDQKIKKWKRIKENYLLESKL